MLQYFLLFFIGVSLYASEGKSTKKEEAKFVLKEGENIFKVKLSSLPALANMVTDLMPSAELEEFPTVLSNLTALSGGAKVSEDTLIILNNVQNAITEKEPLFFSKMNYWANHNRYVVPDNWGSIVSNYLSPSKMNVSKLIECATVAARYENLGLAHVILTAVADRLIQGENKNTPLIIENPDLDKVLARMIISKALLDNVACSIIKVPMRRTGQYQASVNSALLCRTATKEGCCFVLNKMNDFKAYVLREQSVLNTKWLYMQPFYQHAGETITVDASSDLLYQLMVIKEQNYPYPLLLLRNTVNNHVATMVLSSANDVSVVFENSGYDFYLKIGDKIFKSNAKQVDDSGILRLKKMRNILLSDMDDLFIRKQFEKRNELCRCLEQKQITTFDTRALHTITYTTNFLDELKRVYNNADFAVTSTACNCGAFTHSLLMQDLKNANLYYAARVSFSPDQRIHPFITCMNELPTNGTLYAHALCVYHLYTNQWLLSVNGLEKKMGSWYSTIAPSMKTIIEQSAAYGWSPFSYFGALIKKNIGLLKLPAIAAAVVGGVKLVAMSPGATLTTLPLIASVAWNWRKFSQGKHLWTAPKIKDQLQIATLSLLLVPMTYYIFIKENRMNSYH